MQQIYTQQFFMSAGEVNAEGEMSLPLLVSKLIDMATAHANVLHFGNPDMAEHQAGWVLSRMAVEMDSYPKANENYSISTWVESWTRRFSTRCFMISDSDGRAVGYARSVWMILSTATHESLPLTILNFDSQLIVADKCPRIDMARHTAIAPFGATDALAESLPATVPACYYTFKYCDLDFYRHVNTVRYVALLMNQFSLSVMDQAMVSRLEMSFLHEGHYGERVELRQHDESESTSLLSLVGEDGRNILFSRIILRPRG